MLVSQRFISGRETRHWAVSPPKFDIFLTFPNFLFSWENSYANFLYQISSSVFLFASWTCTKTLKTSKNYDHECLKIFFCSLHLLWWLKCQKKNDHFSQKRYFYQKLSRKNVSSFPKSYFDINQTCQIVLTQNRYFWNFNATGLLYLSIKVWRKALKL